MLVNSEGTRVQGTSEGTRVLSSWTRNEHPRERRYEFPAAHFHGSSRDTSHQIFNPDWNIPGTKRNVISDLRHVYIPFENQESLADIDTQHQRNDETERDNGQRQNGFNNLYNNGLKENQLNIEDVGGKKQRMKQYPSWSVNLERIRDGSMRDDAVENSWNVLRSLQRRPLNLLSDADSYHKREVPPPPGFHAIRGKRSLQARIQE